MRDKMKIEIIFPSSCEQFIRLQCNGDKSRYTEPSEAEIMNSYLKGLSPKCVLDLGCGIGRIGVYLFKRYEWKNIRFVLADGDSGKKQLHGIRTGRNDFYNSMNATREFCEANGMKNVELLDLEKQKWGDMQSIPDLVISFLAFGFHWPIDYCLNSIYPYIAESSLLLFGMRPNADGISRKWHSTQMKAIDRTKYKVLNLVRGIGINMLALERI